MAQNSGLDEVLSSFAIEEAETIWKTDLDLLPDRDYINSPIRNWENPPPEILDNDFKEFGLKLISLVKEELLRLWILNRSDLFAILKEHSFPRPLRNKEERHELMINLAKNEGELKWAAVWLIWKRVGGILEDKEEKVFKGKINEKIPNEYQELQKINRKESQDFVKGNTFTRLRIAELGEENLRILDCLGINNNILNRTIAAIKLLNKDLITLKESKEKLEKDIRDNDNALSNLKDFYETGKIDLKSLNDLKLKVEILSDNYKNILSALKPPLGREVNKEGLVIKKLDFITRAIKRIEPKVNLNFSKDRDSVKNKKEKARLFYNLRQQNKKSKNKLNAIQEKESLEKENSSLGSNSFYSQSLNASF